MTTTPADKQTNNLKSIIIPISIISSNKEQDKHQTNQTQITISKITTILNHLNTHNSNLILTTCAIHNLFKNQPFKNTPNTQNTIKAEIIQINQISRLQTDNSGKTLSNSGINMAINRLKKANVLNFVDGWYSLIPAISGIDEVDQVVFRWVK